MHDDLCEGMLRIAGWLTGEMGIVPGDRVAICLPKSLAAVQLLYGILAASATYVPLQFRGPPARLATILGSVRPRLLLTTREMSARLSAFHGMASSLRMVTIEDDGGGCDLEHFLATSASAASIPEVDAEAPGAIYFTSGSTGEPKGVVLSHQSIAMTLAWVQESRQEGPDDCLISLAGLHYVASIGLFFPILSGSSQFLLPESQAMFPDQVGSIIERERITQLLITSTALRLLSEGGALERRDLGALRRVEFFGEPFPVPLLRQIMAILPGTEFVNIYGATEAYDMANYAVPRPLPENLQALPLGKPCPRYELMLRDDDGAEVPKGAVGEICVRGPQVMSGYWDDPELTAMRRLDGRPDSYRTGDLATIDDAGLLHLVGRRDQMIKLRGHRIDLGEVEAVLKAHPAVHDAVALLAPAQQTESQIHAFVVAESSGHLMNDLGRLCRERLPRFSQPARISVLNEFPLLSTGKVDRQALNLRVSREAP